MTVTLTAEARVSSTAAARRWARPAPSDGRDATAHHLNRHEDEEE
jgi:hypothetical protein